MEFHSGQEEFEKDICRVYVVRINKGKKLMSIVKDSKDFACYIFKYE